ncbi:hypothetical protein [Embleya hyalina]|uniref:Uncharacterized protein n=1 Tax=Embleya hyalina TaxID=516124 RepID=A0A401Z5Y0_9ACTN|nr:hypothetical protein [Embleya hyalina]GCE02270.1 hypothetical protein EHYA_10047 [Embleya hyalina]
MKHARKLTVGLGAVAMSVGMVATASVANAGTNATDYGYNSYTGAKAAKVYFQHNGDVFYIHDLAADGWGVAVQYRVNNSNTITMVHWGGANTMVAIGRSEIPEGATVQFRACRWLSDRSDCGPMAWSESAVKAKA